MPRLNVIDLNLPHEQTTRRLIDALETIGFAALANHGIPSLLIDEIRAELQSLFNRPDEEKLSLKVEEDNYRGYVPFAFFSPNAHHGSADQYEAYKLHWPCPTNDPIQQACDLYGPNKWPAKSERLHNIITSYWRHCEQLSSDLLRSLADPLGISREFFVDVMQQPLSNMTLLHYPPALNRNLPTNSNTEREESKPYGIHPHKDTDVLTLLVPDPNGGLYIRARTSNDWIEAPKDPSLVIVNVGDMLESWSCGRLVSTPHKVVNRSTKHRYSFPFFAVPRYDVSIEPIITHRTKLDPNHGNLLRGMAGEISAQIWRSNWPDSAAIAADLDPFIQD